MERLKRVNRTLLEMHLGMCFFGICCQTAGLFLAKAQGIYARSLWFGIAFAFAASIHMCRTLERSVAAGANTVRIVTLGYFFRYAMIAFVLTLVSVTKVMDPLIVFLGYMSLKVTAYLQPFTHKLCNKLFHETDPVPEAMPEEGVSGEGEAYSE